MCYCFNSKRISLRAVIIKLIVLGFLLGLILLIWAIFVEPDMLERKKYKLAVQNLRGLKIVLLSDLHLAPGHGKKLQKIVAAVNQEHPDIILLGGDYVKGHKRSTSMNAAQIAAGLGALKARYGVYAVLGNHDGWYGGPKIETEFAKQNICVLKNENVKLSVNKRNIFLAGVEDFYTGTPDLTEALKGTNGTVLLLSHSPDIFPDVPPVVDLTLAGHTHGGQVKMPFWGAILTSSIYGTKYAEGLITDGGKKMIVTKGIGTSLLPLRFNCRPEIVVIEFE